MQFECVNLLLDLEDVFGLDTSAPDPITDETRGVDLC